MRLCRAFGAFSLAVGIPVVMPSQARAETPPVPPQPVTVDAYPVWTSEYQGCVGGQTLGIRDFKDLLDRQYPSIPNNLGTYVCDLDSSDQAGRAYDWGVGTGTPPPGLPAAAVEMINFLNGTDLHGNADSMARRFGLQYLIWNGYIYSTSTGYNAVPYCIEEGGNFPCDGDPTRRHNDHVHFSLSVAGGSRSTSVWQDLYMAPDATSWGASSEGFFFRDPSNQLRERYWSASGGWSAPEVGLGGVLRSGAAATSWGNDRVDVFVRGSGNGLYHRSWESGSGWYPSTPGAFENLGAPLGGMTSGPDASSWTSGAGNRHINVFARGGSDGTTYYYRTYNSSSCPCGWDTWLSLSGDFTSDPGAVSWGPGRIDLFGRGLDNQIYHRYLDNGWSPTWESLGGQARGGPDAATVGAGQLSVFIRGLDNSIWYQYWGPGWSGWISLGAPPGGATSDPSATARSGGLDLYVRGANGAVWTRYWNTSGWSTWAQVGSFPV